MDLVMRYENPSGETVTFVPERFIPLTCQDFVVAHNDRTNLYEIRADATEIEICAPNGEITNEERGRVTMPINFHRSLPVYALVEGGWLPPPLVLPPVYLFDRNVIGYIQQISKGNPRDLYTDADWWLQMIADDRAHISPFLYAFESNQQMIPDLAEFKRSYQEAIEIIRGLFPEANIIVYGDEHFAAAHETMADVLKFHAEETEFLQRVVPLIRESVSENSLQRVCNEILTIATDIGLSFKSLPLIASLSCLHEDPLASGYNAARELLKPGGGTYTNEKAYNVLSDMRGLMFYLAFQALAKQMGVAPVAYCTADKAALLFGCGLNFSNVEFRGNQLFLSVELSEFLFPRLRGDQRQELARRMEA
jgi:hypothetical protein